MARTIAVPFRCRVVDAEALFGGLRLIPAHERAFTDEQLDRLEAEARKDQISNDDLSRLLEEAFVHLDTIGLARSAPQSFLDDLGFEIMSTGA